MYHVLVWAGIFLASLAVLIKSSDYFTEYAEKLGLYLKLPAFVVGVIIVSVGTSLPELISSIYAVLKGSSEIVIGNAVGSNITNIFLVLGFAAILGKHLKIEFNIINVDLPLMIGSAFFLGLIAMDGHIGLFESILCIAGFIIYLAYTVDSQKTSKDVELEKEVDRMFKKENKKKLGYKIPLMLLGSGFFIYLGATYTVESIIQISNMMDIGTEIIAVSAVALGTSLPELFVSINAARKGNPEMAVGNVLGSNIFNAFAVIGIPGLLGGITVPASIISFSLPLMVMASLFFFFIGEDKEITRWEGFLLVIFYIFFLGHVIGVV